MTDNDILNEFLNWHKDKWGIPYQPDYNSLHDSRFIDYILWLEKKVDHLLREKDQVFNEK